MRYAKPALSLDELVTHLASIGLQGERPMVAQRLKDVGYYRLSPYWRYFRKDPASPSSHLRDGTSIDDVWRLYTFDRELRLLVMDAIERVEIAVRSRLVQAHVSADGHDPFSYAEDACAARAPACVAERYRKLLNHVRRALERAVEQPDAPQLTEALRHFARTYGDTHCHPPLWLAAEDFSFGDLVTLYRGSPREVRKAVAIDFKIAEPVFESWLLTIQAMRNTCAHHCRLWNRVSGLPPKVPRHDRGWSEPVLGSNRHTFFALTMLAHFLGIICDGSTWARRFLALVERYPTVPRGPMGMGDGWTEHAVWRVRLGDGA